MPGCATSESLCSVDHTYQQLLAPIADIVHCISSVIPRIHSVVMNTYPTAFSGCDIVLRFSWRNYSSRRVDQLQ